MYDSELAHTILLQIDRGLKTIQRRFAPVASPDDFTASDAGMEKLDAICMQLIVVGESVKNLDKVTNGALLVHYSTVEWKKVMGMRDVISHHYFDVDAEIVFTVCEEHIPNMETVVKRMLSDLSQGSISFEEGK
jgi:uncharacterized protein with HEPN domain